MLYVAVDQFSFFQLIYLFIFSFFGFIAQSITALALPTLLSSVSLPTAAGGCFEK